MVERDPSDGWLRPTVCIPALFALALAVRAFVAARTAMPDWDGVHFMWLADQVASGDVGVLFRSEYFHPGFPTILGFVRRFLAPDADAFVVAQCVACGLSSLTVLPLWFLGRRIAGVRGAFFAVLLFATGTWFVRFAADGLSESLFHPLVAWSALTVWSATHSADKGRGVAFAGGVLGGMAFAVRPEGASLVGLGVLWLGLLGRWRRALLCAIGGLCVFGLLVVAWRVFGGEWVVSPKLAFVYQEGVGTGGVAHYFEQLVKVPAAVLEGVGWWTVPLAVFGLFDALYRGLWVLVIPLAVQCVVAPGLKAHYRFFSGFGVLLLPLAARSVSRLVRACDRAETPGRRRAFVALLLSVLLAPDVARLSQARRVDRVIERELGQFLVSQGATTPGVLFTDMTRVAFYAGLLPNPPRRWRRLEVEAALADPAVRLLALVDGRLGVTTLDLESHGFRRLLLPPGLAESAGRRRASVWYRGL